MIRSLNAAILPLLLLFLLSPARQACGQSREQGRWSVGLNAAMPFFWGDMNSRSYDGTYAGYMVGLQATRQFTPLLGATLNIDYAHNRAGARDYNRDYLLDKCGNTYYTPQQFPTLRYDQAVSRIGMWSAGLSADVNLNRLFPTAVAYYWPKLIVSPGAYLLWFNSAVTERGTGDTWAGGGSGPTCLGLGCDIALRQAVSRSVDVQLRGTGMWIADNRFDGVTTPSTARQNAMWSVGAGVVWYVGAANGPRNLIYNPK